MANLGADSGMSKSQILVFLPCLIVLVPEGPPSKPQLKEMTLIVKLSSTSLGPLGRIFSECPHVEYGQKAMTPGNAVQ